MIVSKLVNFNGKNIEINGTVRFRKGKVVLVSFNHDGGFFIGFWKLSECKIISRQD